VRDVDQDAEARTLHHQCGRSGAGVATDEDDTCNTAAGACRRARSDMDERPHR